MAAQRKPYYGRPTTRIQEHVGVLGDYKCAQDLLTIDLLEASQTLDRATTRLRDIVDIVENI